MFLLVKVDGRDALRAHPFTPVRSIFRRPPLGRAAAIVDAHAIDEEGLRRVDVAVAVFGLPDDLGKRPDPQSLAGTSGHA